MPHGLEGSAVGVTTTQARIVDSPPTTAPDDGAPLGADGGPV